MNDARVAARVAQVRGRLFEARRWCPREQQAEHFLKCAMQIEALERAYARQHKRRARALDRLLAQLDAVEAVTLGEAEVAREVA